MVSISLSGQKHFFCCCRPPCTYHPFSKFYPTLPAYKSARHSTVCVTCSLVHEVSKHLLSVCILIKPENLFEQIAQNHYLCKSTTNDSCCTTSNSIFQKSMQISKTANNMLYDWHGHTWIWAEDCKCITFKVDLSCSVAARTIDAYTSEHYGIQVSVVTALVRPTLLSYAHAKEASIQQHRAQQGKHAVCKFTKTAFCLCCQC